MGERNVFDNDEELAELFDGLSGATLATERDGIMFKRLVLTDRGAATSTALELAADEAKVTVVPDDDAGRLRLEVTIRNRLGVAVELEELYMLARRADGTLLDYATHWISTTFSQAQEVVHDFMFPAGVVEDVESLEVWVDYEFEFRRLMAAAEVCAPVIDEDSSRARVPLTLSTSVHPGPHPGPAFDVTLSAYCAFVWEPEVSVLLELVEREATEGQPRDLVVALRDGDGEILAKDVVSVSRGTPHTPSLAKLTFNVPASDLARLQRIDVAVRLPLAA